MGSQQPYQVAVFIVLVLFFASAGRIFAQDENPPVEPIGLLGTPPIQPTSPPVVGSPPIEQPDSTPVIEHPPENEPQPEIDIPSEESETNVSPESSTEQPQYRTPIEPIEEQSLISEQSQQINIAKLDIIR